MMAPSLTKIPFVWKNSPVPPPPAEPKLPEEPPLAVMTPVARFVASAKPEKLTPEMPAAPAAEPPPEICPAFTKVPLVLNETPVPPTACPPTPLEFPPPP